MRFLLVGALCVGAAGCGGDAFTTGAGSAHSTGPDAGTGGGASGGRGSGGAPSAGGAKASGGASSGGGTGKAGGGNGGSIGSGGAIGNGGVSAGGGPANGGATGSGGVSAGGAMGNGGASAGGVVGNGGAPTGNSGDCTLNGTDCHNGTRCVEVTPGGYRVCAVKYPEANACAMSGQCCQTSDCQNGAICYPEPLAPQCGGAVILGGNVCSSGTCTADSDCGAGAICAPAGTFQRKVRMCVPASCHLDSDCRSAPNGICAPVSGGCCDDPFGLYCVYPNSGCRDNSDCTGQNCEIDQNGASFCDSSPVICPV